LIFARVVLATQEGTQGAILGTPIKKAAWHSKPSWFVIAANYRTITPEQEKSTAERTGAKVLTLPISHLPMLSPPQKVADFVIGWRPPPWATHLLRQWHKIYDYREMGRGTETSNAALLIHNVS
jgi:hypothetical protein